MHSHVNYGLWVIMMSMSVHILEQACSPPGDADQSGAAWVWYQWVCGKPLSLPRNFVVNLKL